MDTVQRALTFLVVDDDIPLSVFFKETLQRAGHTVHLAVSEHTAMEIFRREAIDILLCDLMLPGMSGSSIIDIVKQQNKEIFCVLISGHHYELQMTREHFTNADMIISKPVLKESLNRIIKQYTRINPVKFQ